MRILDSADGRLWLNELRPQVGDYRWLWPILRFRSWQKDGVFPARLLTRLRPLCRKRYFVARISDGTLFVGDVYDLYSAQCAFNPTYDSWLVTLLCDLAKQHPGAVLDIGANQGLLTASIARQLGPSRSLVAFEPVPETANRAAATFALNGLSNATVLAIGVGDTDEDLQFNIIEGNSDLATTRAVVGTSKATALTVPCRRLDSLLDNALREPVGLMKIDVEGFEPNVVRGAQSLIARDRPAIVFEYWPEAANQQGWRIEDVANGIVTAGGNYRFDAYQGGHEGEQQISYPPPSDRGIYNIVAQPA